MGEPGFWDNQERAAQVSAEHARASRKLETFRALERDADDLEALGEMAEEDPSLESELLEQVANVEGRLEALEEQRLRHRRPGLGRDGVAHGDALGREAGLPGRAARGIAW
jgi:protein subunit release factor A